jgi:hypothetical protein
LTGSNTQTAISPTISKNARNHRKTYLFCLDGKTAQFWSTILNQRLFKARTGRAPLHSNHFFGGFCAKKQVSARDGWEKLRYMVKYRRLNRKNQAADPYFACF